MKAYILLKTKPGKRGDVQRALEKRGIDYVMGGAARKYDIVIPIESTDISEFYTVGQEVLKIPGIARAFLKITPLDKVIRKA